VPILRTDTEGSESEIFAIGGNLEWKATDNLGFVLDYGYSTLDRQDIDYESYAGTGRARSGAQDTLTFDFAPDGTYSIDGLLDYTDPANVLLTDPGGWGQVGFSGGGGVHAPVLDEDIIGRGRILPDESHHLGYGRITKSGVTRSPYLGKTK
jgi:hypothetical protein